MMELKQQLFLALLRAGLWDSSVDTALFEGNIDWTGIFRLAAHQTVKGIIADAVNKLPDTYRPLQPVMRELAFYIARNRMCHARHNAVLGEIIRQFTDYGINPVLLKGQGMSLNYPEPTLRHCGDIDLYIGEDNFEKGVQLAAQCKDVNSGTMLIAKHYEFEYRQVSVELHRMVELNYIPWRNKYMRRLERKYLQDTACRSMALEGVQTVFLPPCQFDVVFILEHAWHHFVFLGGVGLRQICDWAMCLHHCHDKIDILALEKDVRKLGLKEGWKLFGYIAVNYLGLPPSELPFYDESAKTRAKRALQQILTESYGQEHTQQIPSGYVERKMKAFSTVFGRWKIIRQYEGTFNMAVYLIGFLTVGSYRMLRYWGKE